MSGVLTFLMSMFSGAMARHAWSEGNEFDAVTFAVCATTFLAYSVYAIWAERPQRWRHIKRGGTYVLITPDAFVQTEKLLGDYDPVAIYRDEKTGRYVVRRRCEFFDGRFERI